MKKTKHLASLGVTILVSLVMAAPSYAKAGKKPVPNPLEAQPVTIDTPTTHNQRQKMQHSARKQAALRLKGLYQKAREDNLAHQGKPTPRRGR